MTAYENPKFADILLPFQLLVEGNDSRNFFEALVNYMNLAGKIEIRNFGVTDELREYLQLFVKIRGFEDIAKRVGIVRDAEGDACGAFESVCGSLKNANLPVPDHCEVFTKDSPFVGVMLLPGDNQNGMLETLLRRTIVDRPESACIEEFFRCLFELEGYEIARRDKAWAHAYLATRPHPEVSVGFAAKKGYWNFDHDEFAPVRNFLTALTGTSNLD